MRRRQVSETAGHENQSAARELGRYGRLALRLFADRRVPIFVKLVPLLAIVYLLWPIDLIPDLPVPILGQLDDLAILLIALRFFVELSPEEVVSELQDGSAKDAISATYRTVDDEEE